MSPAKSLPWMLPRLVVFLLSLLLTVTLGMTLFSFPAVPTELVESIHHHMPQTGVSNPITGVLLNFRGYDTFLEIAVLLVAALGVKALPHPPHVRSASIPASGPILRALVRLAMPLMVLTAGYLLWSGSDAPGGAFQAGAILGAGAVLILLAGLPVAHWFHGTWFRLALVLGFVLFLGVGLAGIVSDRHFLEYPRDLAGALILLIEGSLTISIALVLATLFLSNPHESSSDSRRMQQKP